MTRRKIVYSEIALSKRKTIKKDIKERYGKERADKFSEHISGKIAELKKFPELGVPLREKYDFDCDYYMLFVEHNYFIYRIFDDLILILEIFNEKKISCISCLEWLLHRRIHWIIGMSDCE